MSRRAIAPPPQSGMKDSLWFNILVMIGVCILLYFFIFSSLSLITQHGSEVRVPSVTDRPAEKAVDILFKAGFDVSVDSSYEPGRKPQAVLSQQPLPGAVVKQNRTIFLLVNRTFPPATTMPNLVNLSIRSASLILKSHRLVVGDTILRPDIARGAVLEQRYNGRIIPAGISLPEGSRITLVVGDGLGQVEFDVPDVIGMSYTEGRAVLMGNGLNLVPVFEGSITDSATAVIYNQVPSPYNEGGGRNQKRQGDYVDVFVKQNPTTEEMEANRRPEPAFVEPDMNTSPTPEMPPAPPRKTPKKDSVR